MSKTLNLNDTAAEMKNQKFDIKKVFFPEVEKEVQANMNAECIRNIYRLSVVGMIFMLLSLAVFIPSLGRIDSSSWYRIGKFVGGFLIHSA